MSKQKSHNYVMAKQGIKVSVHNSPPRSVPLALPTSPDMIPAFVINDNITTGSEKVEKSLKRDRKPTIKNKLDTKKPITRNRELIKTNQDSKKSFNRNPQAGAQNPSIPLNIKKQKRSSTLTNLMKESQKPERKVVTSREPAHEKDVDDFLKTFLKSDFPPYNPEDFTPKDDVVTNNQEHSDSKKLLSDIRQELHEWLTTIPEGKKSCPEQWTSVTSKYTPEETTKDAHERKRGREDVPSKENVGIQTTPPRKKDLNVSTLTFLNNPDLMSLKGPKTPSPLPRTKVLEAADRLLSVAEREFSSAEARMSSDHLLSAKTSSLFTSELPSARRVMTNAPSSPTKGSVFSNSSLRSRPRASYRGPQNSPSSLKVHEENYKTNNGEKKNLDHKLCPHHKNTKPSYNQSEVEQSNLSKSPTVTEFSMFYEQQKLVERKTQNFKEKNSATVIFKSDAKIVSSTDVVKHDAQTNTGPILQNVQPSLKFTPNSSIINMKTSKPEEDERPVALSGKVLNVQKMPSVNIRPGFTIQHGPKINIVGSSSTSYKSKRKNTEFYDVVYPPTSPVFSEASFVSEPERQNRQTGNHIEYVCERHTFPGGRLIPGTLGENLRQSHLQNSLSLDEKKEMLIELIKTVTEKVEKQSSLKKKKCCRLVLSLPLLASVVRKIEVDCVKCVDLLNGHLDRLVVLMKEELRGHRELSDDRCCQLDETVHYQIVELELMQEENVRRQTVGTVTIMKHTGSEPEARPPRKTVSFESIPDELAQTAAVERRKHGAKVNHTSGRKVMPTTFGNSSKPCFVPQLPYYKITQNMARSITDKNKSTVEQKQSLNNANRTSTSEKCKNSILKKKTEISTKDKTVVGQVVQNLSRKKSILKHDTSKKSMNINKSNKGLNSFIQLVDQKDTTSEFDKWVEERSLKIQQIHDELNKMVASSMEEYLENQITRYETDNTVSGLKLLNVSRIHVNKGRLEGQPEDMNERRSESQAEENKTMDNDHDSSIQDPVQEYDEDFEEDVEDPIDVSGNGSDNNIQQSVAEAVNDSNSTLDSEEVGIDEEKSKDVDATGGKTLRNVSNLPIEEKVSSNLSEVDKATVNEHPVVQMSSDISEKVNEDDKPKFEKVSVATSPINFKTTSQSVDASVNTSLSHLESRKVTTATSPVNLTERGISQFKSTTVQTESLAIKESKSLVSNQNDVHEVELSVPSVRLNPTPIENILKVTLGDSKKKSVALHADSSNQALKLIVQLPPPGYIENRKIIELDCSDQSEREVQSLDLKHGSDSRCKTNVSTNQKSVNSTSGGSKFYETAMQDKMSEQAIKDIIEPTVSEVLKRISKESKLPTSPVCGNEELKEAMINPNTCSNLLKPNIILQTKHGVLKTCDENSILSLIDYEQSKQKVDSANQTETEKQNACVQVADSVAGSDCAKATSARKCYETSDRSRSYLEMLLPLPPCTGTVLSSLSHSPTCCSSSTSSTATSTSSRRKDEKSHLMERLSDGELLPVSCGCQIGEVCEVCVPKLDLSFGELKRKKRGLRTESGSSSDHSKSQHTSVSFSNLPRNLEPRPTCTRIIPSSAPNLTVKRDRELKSDKPNTDTEPYAFTHPGTNEKTQRKSNVRQFSEIARSVLNDLGKELRTFNDTNNSKYFPKPVQPSTMNFPSSSNQMETSSSESLKSSKSQSKLFTKKSLSKHGGKTRTSLVIRTPVETPRIDVVIEDPDLSTSSYQTSVTSVSVDQLPDVLSSHSSADASS